jgi:hypothetical protein
VEGVVDVGFVPLDFLLLVLDCAHQTAFSALEREVDEGRRPAVGRRAAAEGRRLRAHDGAQSDVEVNMRVDPARDHILAAGVDCSSGFQIDGILQSGRP